MNTQCVQYSNGCHESPQQYVMHVTHPNTHPELRHIMWVLIARMDTCVIWTKTQANTWLHALPCDGAEATYMYVHNVARMVLNNIR